MAERRATPRDANKHTEPRTLHTASVTAAYLLSKSTMASLFNQKTPPSLFIAQAIGLTASGYLLGLSPPLPPPPSPHCIHARAANDANTGQNGGLSFNAVPAIMQAPAPLAAKQWYTILINGGTSGMPLAILSGVATAYVAYNRAYPSPTLPMSPWQTVQLTIMDRGPAHPPLPPQRRGRPPLSQHRALYTLLHRPDQREAAGQDARTRSYVAGG